MLPCSFPRKLGHTEPQIPHAEQMPRRQTVPVLFLHGVGLSMSSRVMLTHLCQLPILRTTVPRK